MSLGVPLYHEVLEPAPIISWEIFRKIGVFQQLAKINLLDTGFAGQILSNPAEYSEEFYSSLPRTMDPWLRSSKNDLNQRTKFYDFFSIECYLKYL